MNRLARATSVAGISLAALLACTLPGCHSPTRASGRPAGFVEIDTPAPVGSRIPVVSGGLGGGIVFNWIEPTGDRTASLRFSIWKGGAWSATKTVLEGHSISRSPDEAPGVVALSSSGLIAFWSERHRHGTAGEDQNLSYVSGSTDGGSHWSTPHLLNLPGAREASNLAAAALDERRALLVWLDGRDWESQRRFLLASVQASPEGAVSKTEILDPDTCTCCPPSVVRLSSGGGMAAYRGHTSGQIRDLYTVSWADSVWSAPERIHPDNWKFAGCPVNGPALDEVAGRVAAAWFTGADDSPKVQLALTSPGSGRFETPVRVDSGNPKGRPQIVGTPDGQILVLWLENQGGSTRLLARRFRLDGQGGAPVELAEGKSLAFPRAAHDSNVSLVAWEEEGSTGPLHVAEWKF